MHEVEATGFSDEGLLLLHILLGYLSKHSIQAKVFHVL